MFSQRYSSLLKTALTMRLIGPISYPGECDLIVHPRKYSVIFSRIHSMNFVYVYNMH